MHEMVPCVVSLDERFWRCQGCVFEGKIETKMLIKSRNFSPTKCENTFEKDGFGWAPGQEKRFEGVGINSVRYGKNFSMMKGVCKK